MGGSFGACARANGVKVEGASLSQRRRLVRSVRMRMSRAPRLGTTRFLGAHMVAPMQLPAMVGLILRPSGPRSPWGIPAEDLPRIFDRFYQASADPEGNSAGLGLAIVKRIVELHDSQIAVASRVAEGTTFSFMLPVSEAV